MIAIVLIVILLLIFILSSYEWYVLFLFLQNTGPSSYKPARRYPTRDSLLNRHRDLSQENKRLLGVPPTRNSSLAPLLRDGPGLGGILGDIPDYYTDGGETIFTGKAL